MQAVAEGFGHKVQLQRKPIGGAALNAANDPLPADHNPRRYLSSAKPCCWACRWAVRRLITILVICGLRRGCCGCGVLRANLRNRPVFILPALDDCSPLRAEVVRATDIMIVRELLGGLYFGQPRFIEGGPGARVAVNTMRYGEEEIERIARAAFELAMKRRRQVLSVDKANVLECSRLWREVVTRVAKNYPEVKLGHQYVDSAAMLLVQRPAEFDVVLTENMFGDILSDQAGGVVGSLGLLASASIGGPVGLYEPVHGSAPDIAGKGLPIRWAQFLSVAMLLRHSFQLEKEAACVSRTRFRWCLAKGAARTADLGREILRSDFHHRDGA